MVPFEIVFDGYLYKTLWIKCDAEHWLQYWLALMLIFKYTEKGMERPVIWNKQVLPVHEQRKLYWLFAKFLFIFTNHSEGRRTHKLP